METGLIYRICLALLLVVARLVPARDRESWLQEWRAELDARQGRLAGRRQLSGRTQLDLLRRTMGSVFDAAWLRRQFTRDAEIVHDVRYGARLLRRNPLFSALTVGVLALGIGATVGIFSVVDTLLLRELPYPDSDRIVLLFEAESSNRAVPDDVAPANFLDWRDQSRSFESMAAAEPFGFTYTGGAEPEAFYGAQVTTGFFETFRIEPLYGRTFTADEYQRGRDEVVVLSHSVWAQRFGGDPGIIGQPLPLNGRPRTVVGVMPPAFAPRLLLAAAERGIWAPKIVNEWEHRIRGGRYFNVVGRLAPGVTREQAQAELDGISRRLALEHPRTNTGWAAQVISLRDHLAGRLRPALALLLAGVGLLLLVAAANTANLLIARNANRIQEIAVRAAIGAGHRRLLRQFAAETLLLAWIGCALGLAVAHAMIRLIVWLAPGDIPALATLGVDGRVLLFAASLATLVALVVGVIPAWQMADGQLAGILRRAASGRTDAPTRYRLRAALVAGELAIALVLLAGAGLLLRSFTTLLDTSPGFNATRVAALQIFARRASGDRTPDQLVVFVQQIVDRMRQLPEVQSAGAVSALPFIETNLGFETAMVVEGRAAPAAGDEPSAFISVATPGYFPTMEIPLLEGRLLDDHDRMGSAPVAVVTETLARRHWPSESPIGHRVRYQVDGEPLVAEIVGVTGDVRHDGLDRPPRAELFVPHAQVPQAGITFVARTTGPPANSIGALKAQIHAVDPRQAIYRTATLSELISISLTDRRFMMALLLAFAALAVALAAAGVYGVISVLATQRTREFGLRLALGAGRLQILTMVVRDASLMAGIGLAGGLAAALTLGRVMTRFLYGITPADPLTLAAVVATLAGVALLALALPACRATRIDPIVALRE